MARVLLFGRSVVVGELASGCVEPPGGLLERLCAVVMVGKTDGKYKEEVASKLVLPLLITKVEEMNKGLEGVVRVVAALALLFEVKVRSATELIVREELE